MNTLIENRTIGGRCFEIHFDNEGIDEFDIGSDAENAEYLKRFEDNELFSYAICEVHKCKCCGQIDDRDADWLCEIHAEDEGEAFESYLVSTGIDKELSNGNS